MRALYVLLSLIGVALACLASPLLLPPHHQLAQPLSPFAAVALAGICLGFGCVVLGLLLYDLQGQEIGLWHRVTVGYWALVVGTGAASPFWLLGLPGPLLWPFAASLGLAALLGVAPAIRLAERLDGGKQTGPAVSGLAAQPHGSP